MPLDSCIAYIKFFLVIRPQLHVTSQYYSYSYNICTISNIIYLTVNTHVSLSYKAKSFSHR